MGSRPRELPLQCLIEKSEDGFLIGETRRKKCTEKGTGVKFEFFDAIAIIKTEYLKDDGNVPLTSIHGYHVCDHIVFIKDGREYVLLIELCKGSSKTHDEIIEQLQHGGEQSLRILSMCLYPPDPCHFGFFYVYSDISSHFIRMLRDKKVRFRGKNRHIHLLQTRDKGHDKGFFITNPEIIDRKLIPRKQR